MRKLWIIIAALAVGCGTSNSPTAPATTAVTVGTPATTLTVRSLAISGVPSTFAADAVVQLVATATMSDGTTQGVTRQTTWQSSNLGAATVATDPTAGGLVTGVAPGQTDIQATYQGSMTSVHLTIAQPSMFAVTVLFTLSGSTGSPQQAGSLSVNVAGTMPAAFGQNPFPSLGAPSGVLAVSPQWGCKAPIAVQVSGGLTWSCPVTIPPGIYGADASTVGGCGGWSVQTLGQPAVGLSQCVPDVLSTLDAHYLFFSLDANGKVGG